MTPAFLKAARTSRVAGVCVASLVAAAAAGASTLADLLLARTESTAVSSKVFHGYARTQLPDGTFRPETYVFAKGGNIGGEMMFDASIDDLGFDAISDTIAESLASRNYQPCDLVSTPDEIIAVFWGTTYGASNTKDGAAQDRSNAYNALLLGFDSNSGLFEPDFLKDPYFYEPSFHADLLRRMHSATVEHLESDRYFVVLLAYDYPSAHEGKSKLLWETRFSVDERRAAFNEELPKMAKFASSYFGQETYGLVFKPEQQTRIEFGDLRTIETVSPAALDAIAGRYDYQGLVLTVTHEGDKAYAQLGIQPKFQIYPKSETEYYWTVSDATVSFRKNASGEVVAADYEQAGRSVRANRMSAVAEVQLADDQLDSLVGDYVADSSSRMAISRDGGTLYIQMEGQPRFALGALSANRFFLKQWDARLAVVRDTDGAVKAVVVRRAGRTEEWRRIP